MTDIAVSSEVGRYTTAAGRRYVTAEDWAAALAEAEQERDNFRARLVAAEAKLTRTVYGVCSGTPTAYRVHWVAAEEAAAQKFADRSPDEYWVERFTLYEWDRS
jgi:hypothetical protein